MTESSCTIGYEKKEIRKNSLKVCHITVLFKPYFAGRAIYLEKKVFKKFSEKGVENIVVTANFDDLPQKETMNSGIIYRVPLKKGGRKNVLMFTLRAIPYLFKLRRYYQIIHLHGFWDIYGLFTLFAKIFRKKTILHMTLIGSDDPIAIMNSYKHMNLRFRFISKIDGFISQSSPMSNNYRKTILPQEKLYQIPNGVDTELFSPAASKKEKRFIRKKLNLPENVKLVSFVGAIIKRKGIDLLIEAWINVNIKIKNALLILIGPDTFDGFDEDIKPLIKFSSEMKQIVYENKLNVKFIGRSDQVPLLLRSSDLFVLPSMFEGLPNVVIEAMASGLPVILTEMNGIAYDLIELGEQGFIVHDPKELAEKIIYLLENEDELIRMGVNSRKRALEKFDLEKVCNEYLKVYDNILKK